MSECLNCKLETSNTNYFCDNCEHNMYTSEKVNFIMKEIEQIEINLQYFIKLKEIIKEF